ncbi:hypothetical protein ABAC460_01100 [Asticcacaulis sp. AC460]|uniref:hypothetical protein n=1 Tax=Asticcacaulis sp. AC460 TaxID=1282360 RepID=UPI0003C3C562|nr:hypothetical protein [Asticcacaulis sp. AC460]ESQ93331.1 hypothetical protein ABAC460_01100 [Asticcacaulis sp. AC460]
METALSRFCSRLTVFCALLCMAAALNVGLVQAQNTAVNLQHLVQGEVQLGHDHGLLTCGDGQDHCESDRDGSAPHHHHHQAGEMPTAPLPQNLQTQGVAAFALLTLKPGTTAVPAGLNAPTPDQPPRV